MSRLGDIESKRLLYLKGGLFGLLACLAGTLLLMRSARWDVLVLLLICVWASCRTYYFVFYVIEHYIDDQQRYAGMFDFVRRYFSRTLTRPASPSSDGDMPAR